MNIYGIIGSGGFGREVFPFAAERLAAEIKSGTARLCFVVEQGYPTSSVNGHEVLSFSKFSKIKGDHFFAVAVANSQVRERLANMALDAGFRPFDIRSSSSIILEGCSVAEGLIMAPFSMITANSEIGCHFHANYYSCITHDCRVGNYVTLAPRAQCNGNVILKDHVYVGAGALIRQGSSTKPLVIGEGAIIGMGAVVTSDVAPHTTVVGNPARILAAKI